MGSLNYATDFQSKERNHILNLGTKAGIIATEFDEKTNKHKPIETYDDKDKLYFFINLLMEDSKIPQNKKGTALLFFAQYIFKGIRPDKLQKNIMKNLTDIPAKLFMGAPIDDIYDIYSLGYSEENGIGFEIPLKTIGESAFANSTITSLFGLNDNLDKIGENAFYGCNELKSINELNNCVALSEIGKFAFAQCQRLNIIDISSLKALKTINECTFSGCASLTNVELPRVNRIEDEAFSGCSQLIRLILPQTNSTILIKDNILLNTNRNTAIIFPGKIVIKNTGGAKNINWFKSHILDKTYSMPQQIKFIKAAELKHGVF